MPPARSRPSLSPALSLSCCVVLAALACKTGAGVATDKPSDAWPAVPATLAHVDIPESEATVTLDLEACVPARAHIGLPFGSWWYAMAPSDDGASCQLWLGGETEDPDYEGETAQYCVIPKAGAGSVELEIGEGGPASLEHAQCSS